MTLPALQAYVSQIVAARGFTTDLNEVFILAVEEVGELASELKHRIFYPERFDPKALGHELADVLLYLLDLANGFDVELAATWPAHEATNDARFATRREAAGGGEPARLPPNPTLNRLGDHLETKRAERGFADSPEVLAMLLAEEMGEIATEVRRRWKGLERPERVAHELIDAMTYVLRLAHWFGIDLERAVRDKERENAQRTWSY